MKANAKKRKNDIILTASLLLAVATVGVCGPLFRKSGDTVTVTVDKTVYGVYALSQDQSVEIRVGEAFNLLVIEEGRARVENASCPDGVCAAHRPIFRNGESIVCLPNKVVVTVSAKNENEPDVVA